MDFARTNSTLRRGAVVAMLMLLLVAAVLPGCRDDESGGVGASVEVGEIDLTLVEFEVLETGTYSALANANVRALVRAENVRGAGSAVYRFAPFAAFRLDDDSGIGRGPALCIGCDDAIDAVDLAPGAMISGWLYFELEDGRTAAALRYSAPLSRNRAEFALD
jgi:hypothetical protein